MLTLPIFCYGTKFPPGRGSENFINDYTTATSRNRASILTKFYHMICHVNTALLTVSYIGDVPFL